MSANRGKLLFKLLVLALVFGPACHRKVPHSVTLNWQTPKTSAGMAVVGYNVYRKTKEDGRYIKIAGVSGPPYEDRLVTSGRTYFYVVTALDKKGLESRFSESVQATIP